MADKRARQDPDKDSLLCKSFNLYMCMFIQCHLLFPSRGGRMQVSSIEYKLTESYHLTSWQKSVLIQRLSVQMQKDFISMEQIASKQSLGHKYFNPLHANVTKWPNTFKQFVGNLPTSCLSVFDHFVGLVRIILILKFTKCPIDYKTLGWSLSRSVLPHEEKVPLQPWLTTLLVLASQ